MTKYFIEINKLGNDTISVKLIYNFTSINVTHDLEFIIIIILQSFCAP